MSATDERGHHAFGDDDDNNDGQAEDAGDRPSVGAAAGGWAALHAACAGGDPLAAGEAFERLYGPTVRRLAGRPRFRRVDPHLLADAATDAIADYARRPTTFDPSFGVPLDRFVARAAERNALNLLRSEARRRGREHAVAKKRPESVELPPPAGNRLGARAGNDGSDDVGRLMSLLPDPADRRVFELRLAGERRTAAFAAALGVAHLAADEQRRRVKRAKDRIDKVLRRAVRRDAASEDGGSGKPGDGREGGGR